MSTWSDRTRNAADAVQNTAANQPQYKIAIQGGQPVVRFDGEDSANNDHYVMTTPLASVFNDKSYGIVIATAVNRTPTSGATQHILFHASTITSGNARLALSLRTSGNFSTLARRLDADSSRSATTTNDGNWHIFASECDWSGNIVRIRTDYTSRGTNTFSSGGGNTSNTDSGQVRIGAYQANPTSLPAPADLGQMVILNTKPEDAMLKRIHHHAAFSFKVSCN